MPVRDNKAAIKILIQTLELNPELWETRKQTAEILFDEEQYVEAADVLWGAPEIPSTDTDVAFVIKIVSRAQPNRAIRMIYEIVRRNNGKPAKNMAVARALNEIGMYMQAARFYGAALASDPSLFDLGFERQVLWMDDSHRLIDEWQESDQESKPPLEVPREEIYGGTFAPVEIPENIAGQVLADNSQIPLAPAASAAPLPNPLMTAPAVQRRSVTPTAMLPIAPDTGARGPTTTPLVAPAPIRHAAPAQAVPTQPLQVVAVKAIPAPTQAATEEEPASPYTTIGSTTGRLLTPGATAPGEAPTGPRLKLM